MRIFHGWAGGLGCIALAVSFTMTGAQAQAPARSRALSVTPGFEANVPVDIRAAQLEYSGDLLVGRGGVRMQQGRQLMTADYVQYNQKTGQAFARGSVVFIRADGTVWKGPDLSYNFETGLGDFGEFELYREPYHVYGKESDMPSANVVHVERVVFTTCEGESPREFEVRMREATLTDRRYLRGRDAVVYLGRVPILWWPVYSRDLQGSGRWDLIPGYSSRLGAFLQVHYNYPITEDHIVKGRTGANFYSERGVGFLQDVMWAESNKVWRGEANAFWINDTKLYRDENERADREDYLTDHNRYKLRLRHTQTVNDRNWFSADGTYLSDPYVNQDFYRREYRDMPQPENRATYLYRADHYTASLQINKRLNDFYDNVDRLPEARLAVTPIEIGDSGFYYESDSAAGFLRREYESLSDRTPYDAFRADTYQMVSYPGRYFGYLGFTPRAGYRGTYYSKTRGDEVTTTNIVTNIGTNGVVTVTNVVTTVRPEAGADIRHLPELGFDSSFKAFRVFDEGENTFGRGLRHVVEPYTRYTWNPEPDLRPDHIYQFDQVDALDRNHTIALGLRNKIQTRLPSGSYVEYSGFRDFQDMESAADSMQISSLHALPSSGTWVAQDLVRTDISSYYRIEKYPEENDFGPIAFDVELRPTQSFRLRSRGSYDTYGGEFEQMENQLSFRTSQDTTLTMTHTYRPGSINTLAGVLDLYPKAKWAFRLYERVDLDSGRLEEHSYLLRHRMDCIGWGIGFGHQPGYDGRDADYRVWVQFWLLDLPNSEVQIGG